MFDFGKPFILAAALAIFAGPGASANTYLFRVDCKGETYVAQWDSGPVDPGQNYFRIATGDRNQDCSIYDFNHRTDQELPRRWCSGDAGSHPGIPADFNSAWLQPLPIEHFRPTGRPAIPTRIITCKASVRGFARAVWPGLPLPKCRESSTLLLRGIAIDRLAAEKAGKAGAMEQQFDALIFDGVISIRARRDPAVRLAHHRPLGRWPLGLGSI